ncbi:MAG: hypothetical protein K2N73_05145 [Lachnospiraceae bacterium]|nr:hypothetical protein [Lachnospiraceae bacterium]
MITRFIAIEQKVKDTDFYLIAAGAAPSEEYMNLMLEGFEKYIGCFRAGGNKVGGHVFGVSAGKTGDVDGTLAMGKAFQMGRKVFS